MSTEHGWNCPTLDKAVTEKGPEFKAVVVKLLFDMWGPDWAYSSYVAAAWLQSNGVTISPSRIRELRSERASLREVA